LRIVWISKLEGEDCTGAVARPYKGPLGDKFGFGAFGCGGKRLVRGVLVTGSTTTGEGGHAMEGVEVAVNVGGESDDFGDLGVYGGGGVGFITTSGASPPCFIFSSVVLERLAGCEVGGGG